MCGGVGVGGGGRCVEGGGVYMHRLHRFRKIEKLKRERKREVVVVGGGGSGGCCSDSGGGWAEGGGGGLLVPI